jgi:hypothetical protein
MLGRMTRPRARARVLAGVILALGCASTHLEPRAQEPPPESAQAYYPLQAGWHWAYEVDKGGERILAMYAVRDVVGDTAILETGDERLLYAITPEGIARKEGLSIGDFILRTPMRSGATWAVTGGKATVTAVGKTVTVPAGTFTNCAIVEEVRSNPDRVLRTTFAAGVGPVVVEYQVHDPVAGRFETALHATLRGMTRPGDDPLR